MGEILRPFGDEPKEPEETPVYKPEIRFEESHLVVSFKHPARQEIGLVGQEEPEATTYFIVDPTRDLYPGLLFTPRHILEAVTRGLEGYLDDKELEKDQRALLVHGVFRLNKVLERGELDK